MPQSGCSIFFKLKKPILLMNLVRFIVDWTWNWWLYNLPITDEAEVWDEEAPPMPPNPLLDVIFWTIGNGEKDELVESNKFILGVLCWVDKTTFLLPISTIGLILGDTPLLLLEMRGFKDMKIRSNMKEK
jgi:hypothetical protein